MVILFLFCVVLAFAMLISGWLSVNFGWQSIFYGFGTVGLVWTLVWFIVVKESPECDSRIDYREKDFIKKSLERHGHVNVVKPPWRKIFTSTPVMAIAVADFAYSWGFYTLLTHLPSYMKDILSFDLLKSSFISAIPYLVLSILLFVSGFLADWFQVKNYLSVTQVRKYFNNLSFFAQMIFLLMAAYFEHTTTVIVSITLSVGLGAFALSGFLVNALDIAPQFASIIVGISSSFGTLAGLVSPVLTGFIVSTPVSIVTFMTQIYVVNISRLLRNTKLFSSSPAEFICSEYFSTQFLRLGSFNSGLSN